MQYQITAHPCSLFADITRFATSFHRERNTVTAEIVCTSVAHSPVRPFSGVIYTTVAAPPLEVKGVDKSEWLGYAHFGDVAVGSCLEFEAGGRVLWGLVGWNWGSEGELEVGSEDVAQGVHILLGQ